MPTIQAGKEIGFNIREAELALEGSKNLGGSCKVRQAGYNIDVAIAPARRHRIRVFIERPVVHGDHAPIVHGGHGR